MGSYSGPAITTKNLKFAVDAASDRSYPRSDLAPYWVDYAGAFAAGKYSILGPDSIYINNTSTSWIGRFEALMSSSEQYTIMFDHVADASSVTILDNDSVDDNQWNATISTSTTKQTYSFTRTPAQVSSTTKIQFYIRRNSGGNITISNFRFFKTSPAYDLIGSHQGNLTNGAVFSNLNVGSFNFDGANDYINITNYTHHQSGIGSIEGLVKPTNNGGNRYAFGAGGTSTFGATRALRISGGNWSVVGYGSGTEDWNDIATATTDWQHVVITWSGTTYCFYLDGVKYSATRSGMVTPLGSVLRIGAPPFATNSNFIGSIASVKCYDTALTQAQVTQNYNAYKNRFDI